MAAEQTFKFTEYLDLANNESLEITVKSNERGFYEFAKDGNPALGIKKVQGIRVHYLKPANEPGVDYIDIGQQTLVAQILPFIDQWSVNKRKIKITAFGAGKLKRFTVEQL
jgi:hypothetical protein